MAIRAAIRVGGRVITNLLNDLFGRKTKVLHFHETIYISCKSMETIVIIPGGGITLNTVKHEIKK